MAAVRALLSGQFDANPEPEFARYLGHEHAYMVSSGKSALTILLESLHSLGQGRTVAIPAYTCYSVPAAIIRAGLEPVLIDVDPLTFQFEPASLAQAFGRPDLLAVVPTHLFGIPSDLSRLHAARSARRVYVIDDAAQALGVTSASGDRLGRACDAAIFSLGRGKHLNAGGGIIATSDPAIAERVAAAVNRLPAPTRERNWRSVLELAIVDLLVRPQVYWLPAGLPFLGIGETVYETDFSITGPSPVARATLTGWRERLERANGSRLEHTRYYMSELGAGVLGGRALPLLRFPFLLSSADERAAVLRESRRTGLGISAMYPTGIHRIPALRHRFQGQVFPGADRIAANMVTLPTHEYVTAADRRAVVTQLQGRHEASARASAPHSVAIS